MAYRTKLVMKPTKDILKRLNLEKKGKVQKFFTETCQREMDPYVPYREGELRKSTIHGTEIWYDQNYAEYQYRGERRDGTHKIVNRTRTKHPLATSYWDREMWSKKRYKIEAQVKLEIERLAKNE